MGREPAVNNNEDPHGAPAALPIRFKELAVLTRRGIVGQDMTFGLTIVCNNGILLGDRSGYLARLPQSC